MKMSDHSGLLRLINLNIILALFIAVKALDCIVLSQWCQIIKMNIGEIKT